MKKSILICIFFIFLIHLEPAMARDLVGVAQTAKTKLFQIGTGIVGAAFIIGGILYSLGASIMGRTLLMSGAIGAIAVLGGSSFNELLGSLFGVGIR